MGLTQGSNDTTSGDGTFIFAARDDDPDTPNVREGGRPGDRLFFYLVRADGAGDAVTKRLQVIDDEKDVDILLKAADSPSGFDQGADFRFDIVVSPTLSQAVDRVEVFLDFNSGDLEVKGFEPGATLANVIISTSDNTKGTIDYKATGDPTTSEFILARVTMIPKSPVAKTDVDFHERDPNDPQDIRGTRALDGATEVLRSVAGLELVRIVEAETEIETDTTREVGPVFFERGGRTAGLKLSIFGPPTDIRTQPDTRSRNPRPTFVWTSPPADSVTGPVLSFEVRIFPDQLSFVGAGNLTTFTPSTDIAGGLHTFQVRAVGTGDRKDAIGSVDFFIIDTTPPAAPILLAPEDNAVINTGSVTFEWRAATGDVDVFDYRLQIVVSGDAFNAGPFAIDQVVAATTYTGDLLDNTYRWRVIARDLALNTTSSVTRTFTVDVPPIASFTTSVITGDAPLTVQFTDTSTGGFPTSWLWNFGDGYASTGQNPTYTYNQGGVFTVKLTAINAAGSDAATRFGLIIVTGLVSKIAFGSSSSNSGSTWEIYVMDADGSNPSNLTNNSAFDYGPAWSPNGSKIAFVSDDGNLEIYMMSLDGTNRTRLTNNTPIADFNPTWSPDGSKIAFASREGPNAAIYVMNADGSNRTRLTNNPTSDSGPAWSPDSSKIAFESYSGGNGNTEIYVMNADGSNQVRLTTDPATDNCPTWSPDGAKIAFNSARDSNYEIYVMNADGTKQTRLTNISAQDACPAWSPKGSNIAFASRRDGNDEIYVMDADGSNQVRLTNNPFADFRPDWSPAVFPQVPTGLQKTTPDSDNTPTFTWNATPSTRAYQVRLNTGDWKIISTSDNPAYTVTSLLAEGSHTFYVRAVAVTSFAGSATNTRFTIDTTPPEPPVLVAPEDNAVINKASVTFEWRAATGDVDVFDYRLQIVVSGDAFNAGPFAIDQVVAAIKFTGDLVDNAYQWRVIARDRVLNTASSVTRTFTTASQQYNVTGTVILEVRSDHRGAIVTFSGQTQVFTGTAADGSFQVHLPSGIYTITVEKDGFLTAMNVGLLVDQDMDLGTVKLVGGDVNNDGIIDINDVLIPSKNLNKTESPWP